MRNLVLATVLFAGFAGCASSTATKSDAKAASGRPLYDRLGGKTAITLVVDEMVARIAADSRINARFANTDIPHLKSALVDQICQATGGPCEYKGKDMKSAHAGMKISDEEFGALVEDLKGGLDKYKVGETEQKELIGALGGMKGDVVNQ